MINFIIIIILLLLLLFTSHTTTYIPQDLSYITLEAKLFDSLFCFKYFAYYIQLYRYRYNNNNNNNNKFCYQKQYFDFSIRTTSRILKAMKWVKSKQDRQCAYKCNIEVVRVTTAAAVEKQ